MPERDVLTVRAHALASDGTGVARVDNLVVFVRGLLPGETACVRVTERRKKYWRAEVAGQLVNNTREGGLDNVTAQASRMAPPCPVFGRCGGCDLQHMSYEDTLFWKRRWVKDALVRIAKTDVDVLEIIGMKDPWRYRNKAVLHWDGSSLGWFTANSHEVVEFDDCLLLSRGMNDMVRYLKPYLAVGAAEPSEVVLRQDAAGKVYWIKGSEAGGESESSRFDGSRIEVGDSHLSIGFSPKVFLQVNTEQMDTLLRCVMAVADLREGDVVWDLYCGVGLLGLGLTRCARAVVGVEENADAVSDASENARHNGIDNIEFVAGSVEGFLASDQAALGLRPDLVVVDPPRAGLSRDVVESLRHIRPAKILYVSCDPASLARDAGRLGCGADGAVYGVRGVQPIDMFPWTRHVECVVLMSRVGE